MFPFFFFPSARFPLTIVYSVTSTPYLFAFPPPKWKKALIRRKKMSSSHNSFNFFALAFFSFFLSSESTDRPTKRRQKKTVMRSRKNLWTFWESAPRHACLIPRSIWSSVQLPWLLLTFSSSSFSSFSYFSLFGRRDWHDSRSGFFSPSSFSFFFVFSLSHSEFLHFFDRWYADLREWTVGIWELAISTICFDFLLCGLFTTFRKFSSHLSNIVSVKVTSADFLWEK